MLFNPLMLQIQSIYSVTSSGSSLLSGFGLKQFSESQLSARYIVNEIIISINLIMKKIFATLHDTEKNRLLYQLLKPAIEWILQFVL